MATKQAELPALFGQSVGDGRGDTITTLLPLLLQAKKQKPAMPFAGFDRRRPGDVASITQVPPEEARAQSLSNPGAQIGSMNLPRGPY